MVATVNFSKCWLQFNARNLWEASDVGADERFLQLNGNGKFEITSLALKIRS